MEKKTYLGDSVYAQFDGDTIILTTENGDESDPSNTICLEPAVMLNLTSFAKGYFDA